MWDVSGQYLGILIAANLPVFFGIGKVMFDDWHGFFECVRFYFTPDFFSALRGEWSDDILAELKLFAFVVVCGAVVFGEHIAMVKLGWVGGG
jgi:hypothetical protein